MRRVLLSDAMTKRFHAALRTGIRRCPRSRVLRAPERFRGLRGPPRPGSALAAAAPLAARSPAFALCVTSSRWAPPAAAGGCPCPRPVCFNFSPVLVFGTQQNHRVGVVVAVGVSKSRVVHQSTTVARQAELFLPSFYSSIIDLANTTQTALLPGEGRSITTKPEGA